MSVPSDFPISRFPVPKLDDLPGDIRARLLAVQEKAGFIPMSSSSWRIGRKNSAPSWPITTR